MRKFNFGLRGHDIADNFDEMCKKAKENNIKTIQFALAKTLNEINFDSTGYDRELSKKIKRGLDVAQLNVAVLGCYINPVETNDDLRNIQIERFKNFIHYAKDFNAGVIGTETGSRETIEKTRSDENYNDFLHSIIPVIEKAENMGVVVAIEPVWQFTIHSVKSMKRMIDDIGSKNLSVIFDVSNLINDKNYEMQDEIIKSAFDSFGDRIRTIHLKDYNIVNGKKEFVPTGTGLLNIDLIFKNIADMERSPDIILDELPLALYSEAVARLNNYR